MYEVSLGAKLVAVDLVLAANRNPIFHFPNLYNHGY